MPENLKPETTETVVSEVVKSVYEVLVLCGASDTPQHLAEFNAWWANPNQDEFRFSGLLGFGGKFWRHRNAWNVTCYRENETPRRKAICRLADIALRELHKSFTTDDLGSSPAPSPSSGCSGECGAPLEAARQEAQEWQARAAAIGRDAGGIGMNEHARFVESVKEALRTRNIDDPENTLRQIADAVGYYLATGEKQDRRCRELELVQRALRELLGAIQDAIAGATLETWDAPYRVAIVPPLSEKIAAAVGALAGVTKDLPAVSTSGGSAASPNAPEPEAARAGELAWRQAAVDEQERRLKAEAELGAAQAALRGLQERYASSEGLVWSSNVAIDLKHALAGVVGGVLPTEQIEDGADTVGSDSNGGESDG